MSPEEIRKLVRTLDVTSELDQDATWQLLRPLGAEVVPYLIEWFPTARLRSGRALALYKLIRYARTHPQVADLAASALRDRSELVRYWACAVLAYSLRTEYLGALEAMPGSGKLESYGKTGALLALTHQNHHYFKDQDLSGVTKWIVNDKEDGAPWAT